MWLQAGDVLTPLLLFPLIFKVTGTTTALLFKYVSIERVASAVASRSFFKSWPELKEIKLSENNVHSLSQLDWLVSMPTQVQELTIAENSVASMTLLRPYIAYHIKGLLKVNGEAITPGREQTLTAGLQWCNGFLFNVF
jgi:hypothetical protein